MSLSARPVCGASTARTMSTNGLELTENPALRVAYGSISLVSINNCTVHRHTHSNCVCVCVCVQL